VDPDGQDPRCMGACQSGRSIPTKEDAKGVLNNVKDQILGSVPL